MASPPKPVVHGAAFLTDDLIMEIISWLPVKHLFQLRIVNKFFKNIISNPNFIQLHLKNSSRNSKHILMLQDRLNHKHKSVLTLPISRLINNRFTTLRHDSYYRLNEIYHKWLVIGSCNGLLCLIDIQSDDHYYWLSFWNPATRTKFKRILISLESKFKFSFGYDSLNETYKVVAFCVDVEHGNAKSVVKIFTMGNKDLRNIQSFPVIPLYWFHKDKNNGVYLSGTINWLALGGYFGSHYDFDGSSINVEQYVIVSLDLSTESYTQLLLPQGFDEVPHVQPTIVILMNFLCFCHDFKGIYLVIWQMKDFGIQESWNQLFKISYQNFYFDLSFSLQQLELLPVYLYKNGDTMILAEDDKDSAFIYNCRDHKGEKIKITDKILWLWAKDYVESLVQTC